jgi:hypothetical protein
MIPFDLEKYNSGDYKVVTRDGRDVRILCTDLKVPDQTDVYRLMALVNSGSENLEYYTVKGVYRITDNSGLDLFLKPLKPKEYWVNIYKAEYGVTVDRFVFSSKEDAEKDPYAAGDNYLKSVKVWEE